MIILQSIFKYKIPALKGGYGMTEEILTRVDLQNRIIELLDKVQFLIDKMECEDGVFTFPDGDKWVQSNKK